MKRFVNTFGLIIFLITSIATSSVAQEFKCRVSVNTKDQQESEKEFYNNLRKKIEEFMNNQVWTDNTFDTKEKIEINLVFSIDQRVGNVFESKLQVQANRPVFGSTYNSIVLNIVDEKCKFKYEESDIIELNETSFNSNLSYLLSYYAFMILGLDYDSFSLNGGTKWFQKAEGLVNIAQSQNEYQGWKTYESKENRYWLVENIINPSYSSFRNTMYTYHRLGMDKLYDKPAEGRVKILEALLEMEKLYKQNPNLFVMKMFFQSKYKELQEIFSEGQPDEKTRAVSILKKLDPGRSADYDNILSQKN